MTSYKSLLEQAEEFKRTGQHDRALGVLTYIYTQDPNSDFGINAATLLSGLMKDLGCMDKAYQFMGHTTSVLEKSGRYGSCGGAYASLACGSLYTAGITVERYNAITRRTSMFMEPSAPKISHLQHDMTEERKLRVGILSPDMCLHSLAFLVAQPIINFTKVTPHELYIYHLRQSTDTVSDQIAKSVTKFVHVHGQTDDQIVKAITNDKIDVLIDLSGYTAETRLSVFCRQPAPVQMGWISGMMTPTGLDCLPYFLTDQYMKPETVPTELCTPLIAKTALTYHTLRDKELEIGSLPADRNNYISFVSFNNPCKINDEVLSAWSRILAAVPKSRLHLKTYSNLDTARIYEKLTQAGIDSARLVLMPPLPSGTDVQMYYGQHADIFLDSWPCSGCLTTIEAMWMGVPVVSYYQDIFCSRQTHSILNNVGISDLSFPTVDGYINAAVKLANDKSRLRTLRGGLRAQITASPLHDYAGMARELGVAVTAAWKQTVALRNHTLALLRKAA
jgi:predicted O-linked N-acetylglucosamine transferase (SPINDLY family)